MGERKEAKEAVQAQADTMKAAQVCVTVWAAAWGHLGITAMRRWKCTMLQCDTDRA